MADNELFNEYLDKKKLCDKTQPETLNEIKQYMKVMAAYKQRTTYKPSFDSKAKVLNRIKKRKLIPYRIGSAVVACAMMVFVTFSFLQNNIIQIKPKLPIKASIGNFGISEKDNRPDINLSIDEESGFVFSNESVLNSNSKIEFSTSVDSQKLSAKKTEPNLTLSLNGKGAALADNSSIENSSIDFLKGDSENGFDFAVVNATY